MIYEFENKIKIGNKFIGDKFPTFIIAEIGINHLGNRNLCLQMIKSAIRAGADAVKLQIIDAMDSYSAETESYEVFSKFALSYKDLIFINNYCKNKKIILFATPGDLKSLNLVKKLKMPAIKISSGLLTNLFLIEKACKLNLPLILSSGMSYEKELDDALKICVKNKNRKICLLKCTSLYPANDMQLNLNTISYYKKKYKIITGFSDHTLDRISSYVSVSKGAKVIEKHFTISKKLKYADNNLSMEPKEFKIMVKNIRRIENILGTIQLKPINKEVLKRNKNHRFILANKNIKKGEILNEKNIALKRTNSNKLKMKSKYFKKILGKKSKFSYQINDPIKNQ